MSYEIKFDDSGSQTWNITKVLWMKWILYNNLNYLSHEFNSLNLQIRKIKQNIKTDVARAIWSGPNQIADNRAGTPSVNACAMAQIVCPSRAT